MGQGKWCALEAGEGFIFESKGVGSGYVSHGVFLDGRYTEE